MAESAPLNRVVDMVDYLSETIAEIDAMIHDLEVKRHGFAVRLAVLRASSDPAVAEAAADYEARVAEGRPYESAEPAQDLIAEAHRRFGS